MRLSTPRNNDNPAAKLEAVLSGMVEAVLVMTLMKISKRE
jgi:hypothetical protein